MAFFKTSPRPHNLVLSLILALLLSLNLYTALAVSGDVVGGSSFSSGSARSSLYFFPYYYNFNNGSSSGSGVLMGKGGFIFSMVLLGLTGAAVMVLCVVLGCGKRYKNKRRSVLKLQVGLLGKARSIQKDLDQLAKTADTSTKMGLQNILRVAVSSLLDHPDYCISGYSSMYGAEEVENWFNQLSNMEREKFDAESLVNINNVKVQRTYVPKANKLGKEYIVVTILVAAEGVYELPAIKNTEDLKEALLYLSNICSNKTLAVHVHWTLQAEGDTLSEEELHANYPLLTSIC